MALSKMVIQYVGLLHYNMVSLTPSWCREWRAVEEKGHPVWVSATLQYGINREWRGFEQKDHPVCVSAMTYLMTVFFLKIIKQW